MQGTSLVERVVPRRRRRGIQILFFVLALRPQQAMVPRDAQVKLIFGLVAPDAARPCGAQHLPMLARCPCVFIPDGGGGPPGKLL